MKITRLFSFLSISFLTIGILILNASITFAETKASSLDPDIPDISKADTPPEEEGASNESEYIGRVVDIELLGEFSVKPSFVLRQLDISEGDVIKQSDIDYAIKLLDSTDLFYQVGIITYTLEELDELPEIDPNLPLAPEGVGDIVLKVSVYQDQSFYINPIEKMLIVGERDFMNTGHIVEGAYSKSGKNYDYWHLRYSDPQFLGSHWMATFRISNMNDLFGIRTENTFDLSERYHIRQRSYKLSLSSLCSRDFQINFGIERQENDTSDFSGKTYDDYEHFYFSGEKAPSGDELIFSAGISCNRMVGDPWTTDGHSWAISTEQAFDSIMSDTTFGRYTLSGTRYIPVNYWVDTLVLHGEYKTTSGDPPHYQKPRLGYLLRGHDGLDYLSDSNLFLSGELRKAFWDNRMMGLVFVDLGKGFDSRTITLKNLEMSTGVGLRLDMERFWNWNVILRLDYGWGETGERFSFGIGQDFFSGSGDAAGGGSAGSACGG